MLVKFRRNDLLVEESICEISPADYPCLQLQSVPSAGNAIGSGYYFLPTVRPYGTEINL